LLKLKIGKEKCRIKCEGIQSHLKKLSRECSSISSAWETKGKVKEQDHLILIMKISKVNKLRREERKEILVAVLQEGSKIQ